ncbi:hypothetical protein BJP35_2908 [Enterobacter sp. J49]|uniref:hypothetical protein n=1 Tax=Enterobacter sp. J49 TaxID=1903627 RepID=UPI000A3BD6F8|nr:hypothetical protein [Enterobacter sp. J49]OUC36774.1 hypothetical protein BJP35_2908 [Enterobacter sp. J49]
MKFTLKEMNGLLNGKCLPSDLIVGETLAEYLVRKFSALEQRLIESDRYGRQTDITIDNLEMKLAQMAAENAGLKELIEQHAICVAVCPDCSHEEPSETDDIFALYRSMETPAIDAFLAEVRAQGVDMFSEKFGGGTLLSNMVKETAKDFAAQLRKGVQS